RVAVFEHGHVAGFVEDIVKKIGGLALLESLLQVENEFVESAHGCCGAAGGTASKKHFDGGPKRGVVGFGEIAKRVERGLADAARENVEDSEKRDVVLGVHGEADVGEGVFDFGAIVKTEAADEFVA